ncbi:MAG: hypothetical protein HN352_03535 [Bacteroidetes bacterium]|nr:hypothetical protein [Bacteroidota bacterium]MBT3747831.1 hypothetical protein [Bacteroidota bacterium]MBT4399055.1 hypothetical protein [Bacteroidota bacterium]MBT4408483.1 hypothetical protein [Bacteroidota bacterium]MBT7095509.1 hypothetical protein [Bacteroidota bacterium]
MKTRWLIILMFFPFALLQAQNMSFAKNGKVTSYKEREFQVTGKIDQGLSHMVSPADQYTLHLLKKVSKSGANKLRKKDFFFAGYSQVLTSQAESSDVLIAFQNKNDISRLLMDNYLIPYHPLKRHNLLASFGYGYAAFRDQGSMGAKHVFTFAAGYRLYLGDRMFSGLSFGFNRFQKIQPYMEIPIGWVINPYTYKDTKASFVFNLRMITAPHDSTTLPWYKMISQGGFTDMFSKRDYLFPSIALEFYNQGLTIHMPEISMESVTSNGRNTERSLIIGFRLGYGFGFGSNIGTPFKD